MLYMINTRVYDRETISSGFCGDMTMMTTGFASKKRFTKVVKKCPCP